MQNTVYSNFFKYNFHLNYKNTLCEHFAEINMTTVLYFMIYGILFQNNFFNPYNKDVGQLAH